MGLSSHLLVSGLVAAVLWSCGGQEPGPPGGAELDLPNGGSAGLDTVGVRNLAEGDTTSAHAGLVIISTDRTFGNGEAVAWEFQACELTPVKLIVVRPDAEGTGFELIGESETVVPRRKGANRFVLPEPIPVAPGCLFGLVMPEKEGVPFRKVHNWKTLITTHPLQRPFMQRDVFVTYGWRYSVRVLYRPAQQAES